MTANKRFKRLVRQRARRTGESYLSARSALLHARSNEDEVNASNGYDLVELEIDGVEVAAEVNFQPYVDLREKDGNRRLPIFIGAPEAAAIRFALGGGVSPRPMTHDALRQALQALGGRVKRIVIDLVIEASTFTADVTIVLPDGTERHLDWRPSDALALAVRAQPRPTILVFGAVLDTPPRKLGAAYTLRCACGAPVRFRENELIPVANQPGSFKADGPCPSCGLRVQANLTPASETFPLHHRPD